tara:strand:+ start:401 stop:784 length:384 start_codon:yes stop_codon:yes gene_type:complete
MPDEKKGNGGIAIIGILLAITLICIVAMMFFERYFLTKQNEKVVSRIILLCILINVLILVFLVLTFSKIQFTPGPKGPKGIRGRMGHQGRMDGLNQCVKQSKTLGEMKYETEKGKQIKIQTPSLEVV